MALTTDDVKKVANLARLGIPTDTVGTYSHSLSNILELVDQLEAVDMEGIEPMASPLDAVQRLRPDQVTEANHRDEYQRIAPDVERGLYLVPKVIE